MGDGGRRRIFSESLKHVHRETIDGDVSRRCHILNLTPPDQLKIPDLSFKRIELGETLLTESLQKENGRVGRPLMMSHICKF